MHGIITHNVIEFLVDIVLSEGMSETKASVKKSYNFCATHTMITCTISKSLYLLDVISFLVLLPLRS